MCSCVHNKYAGTYIIMNVCVDIHNLCMYVECMYACMYVHTYVYMYILVHICFCIITHACVHNEYVVTMYVLFRSNLCG